MRRRGTYALVLYSHSSGGHRRSATFLSTHLGSHGYVVAALDHSERVAGELAPQPGETAAQRAARVDTWIANRVPDTRFLLDQMVPVGPGGRRRLSTRTASASWDTASTPQTRRLGVHSYHPQDHAVVEVAPVQPRQV
jgi:Platelet-activating factor acetylhydrolase, isoform II